MMLFSFKKTVAALLCLALLQGAAVPAFAAPPGDPKPAARQEGASQPSIEPTGDADQFVSNLLARYPDGNAVVQILHLEGKAPDPKLVLLEQKLEEAGFEILKLTLTEEKFSQAIEKTALEEGTQNALIVRSSLAKAKGLKALFGTPNGITFANHFIKRDENGKRHKAFPVQRTKVGKNANAINATSISLVGSLSMSTMMIFFNGVDLTSPYFYSAVVLLDAWIFACVYYIDEINSFKRQGNYGFFMGLTVLQDTVINSMLAILLGAAFGEQLSAGGVLGEGAGRGLLSAFSTTPIETYRARETERAARLKREGKAAEAERVLRRVTLHANLFYWIVYPTINYLNLIAKRLSGNNAIAAAPFVIVGAVGMAMSFWKAWFSSRPASDPKDAVCGIVAAPPLLPEIL